MPKAPLSRTRTTKKNTATRTVTKEIPDATITDFTTPKHRDQLHWVIFIAVALLVTGAVIYVGRPDSTPGQASVIPATTNTAPVVVEPTTNPTQGQKGVIGKVTDVTADSITIENMAPSQDGSEIGTLYTIRFTDTTQFVYHPLITAQDGVTKVFSTEPGKLTDIKKDMYASASTIDDVGTQTTLTAIEVGYSEDNPLE